MVFTSCSQIFIEDESRGECLEFRLRFQGFGRSQFAVEGLPSVKRNLQDPKTSPLFVPWVASGISVIE